MMTFDNSTVAFEPLHLRRRSDDLPIVDARALDDAIAAVLVRLGRALPQFSRSFPAPSSVGLIYPTIGNMEWTNGFWTGLMWLAWELTGSDDFLDAARMQGLSFEQRMAQRVNVDHHDLGFL